MQALILAASGGLAAFLVIYVAIVLVIIVGEWKVYTKAHQPGWACIIPLYNTYVLMKIVGRHGWWLVLLFIPIVNIVILIMVMIDLAKSFAKSTGFAVGLIFLPFIFIPVLGFGSAQYVGPAAAA
jgi:uncharacterized membrane protein